MGGQLRLLTDKTKFAIPELAEELLDNDGPLSNLKNDVATLGLTAKVDTRDKDYSPGNGLLIQAAFDGGLNDFTTRQPSIHGRRCCLIAKTRSPTTSY